MTVPVPTEPPKDPDSGAERVADGRTELAAGDVVDRIERRLQAHTGDELFLRHAEAVRAIRAVIQAHVPWESSPARGHCARCGRPHPCPTVRAVGAALNVEVS